MSERIKVDELPAFDAALYLNLYSEEAIADDLTDLLQANDAGLLYAALGDIARARVMTDFAEAAASRGRPCTWPCCPAARRASIRSTV